MATVPIYLKRSSVPGNAPTIGQLEFGELAMNTADGTLYMKRNPGTGEEIVSLVGGQQTFLALDDTPVAYGSAGQVVTINGSGDGLIFSTPTTGVTTFEALTDTPAGYGTSGQYLTTNGSQLVYTTFTGLSAGDNVSLLTNDAGYLTSIPAEYLTETEGDVRYATSAQGLLADSAVQPSDGIEGLDNVSISGISNGQILEWNGSGFVPGNKSVGGATTFIGLDDTPLNYTGQANKMLTVNAGENSVVFTDAPIAPVDSVFGRTGAVTAEASDYNAFYVEPADGIQALDNVDIAGVTDGQVLAWNNAESEFQPADTLPDAPSDGNQYARQDGSWSQVVGGGTAVVESLRINFNAFGSPDSEQDLTAGITSATRSGNIYTFEFTHTQVPTNVIYYGYRNFTPDPYGYRMVVPSLASNDNRVYTGGSSGSPGQNITNWVGGSQITLQVTTTETQAEVGEHVIIFFTF